MHLRALNDTINKQSTLDKERLAIEKMNDENQKIHDAQMLKKQMLIEAQSDGTDDIKWRREIARFQKQAEQDAMKKHWEENERRMIINEKAFNNRLLGALAHQEKCENAYKGTTLQYQKQLVQQKQ